MLKQGKADVKVVLTKKGVISRNRVLIIFQYYIQIRETPDVQQTHKPRKSLNAVALFYFDLMTEKIFVPKAHLETLYKYLARGVGNPREVLKGTGYDPAAFPHPHSPVPVEYFEALNRRGEAIMKDPLFALMAGSTTDGSEFGWAWYAVSAQEDLRHVLRMGAQAQNSVISPLRMETEEADGNLDTVLLPKKKEPFFVPIYLEFIVGLAFAISKYVFGRPVIPARVLFTHAPRAQLKAYEQTIGILPVFEAPRGLFGYSAHDLDTPTLRSDSALAQLSEVAMKEELKPYQSGNADIVEAVRGVLKEAESHDEWKLETVAQKMRVPQRTLQYHLELASNTYVALVENVRNSRATALLKSGALIEDIAARLGYGDAAAFRKAFRRWHGVSPGAWRKNCEGVQFLPGQD